MAYSFRTVLVDNRLNKSKTIVAPTYEEFMRRQNIQLQQWDAQWEKISKRQRKIDANAQGEVDADAATFEAEALQMDLDNMLSDSLKEKDFDFGQLKNHNEFNESKPKEPAYKSLLREPLRTDDIYNPKPGFLTKVFKKSKFIAENDAIYKNDHDEWAANTQKIIDENAGIMSHYKAEVQRWKNDKAKFEKDQKEHNDNIDKFRDAFYKADKEAIEEYIELLLTNVNIPIEFNSSAEVEYIAENKTVITDIMFPTVEDIPKLKAVTYVKSRQVFKESYFSEAQLKKKYDDAVYKLVLIYLNKIFSVNKKLNLIDIIVLNGIVNTVDKTTGNEISPCILSLRVSREDFEKLNLAALDPKAWFRSAKGIAAANISNVTPVLPVQTMSKEDRRFVDGYDVIDGMDSGVNLAAIDWQDFENLVREVFGQEFSNYGGEVKITQASRDGGVDAVAFDPDPIRGGKIIIQAKRYTNVVGVSAVRDLYGTLLNEGAMKGILVTTSYYGNDAYEFAYGKPIQLIDGAGLLALMEKHGHKARINLREAKKILKDEN